MDGNTQQKSVIEFEQEALTVRSQLTAIKIVDQATYDKAVEARKKAREFLKGADEFFDPSISDAHKLHKKLIDQKKSVVGPVNATIGLIDTELVRYDREQERLRQEEQTRLDEIARKAAEEQRLAAAVEMESQGVDPETVEAILDAEPVAIAPVIAAPTYARSTSVSMATTWSGECADIKKVIAAAAKGNKTALSLLQINQPALNGLARSMKGMLAEVVPGCRAVANQGVRGRG